MTIQRIYNNDDVIPDEFHVSVDITVHDGRHALILDHLFNHIQLLNYASEEYLEDPEALWLLHRLKKDKHLSNVDDLGYYLIEKLLEDIEKVGLRQRRSRCSLPKLQSWAQPNFRLCSTSVAALLTIRRMIGDDPPSKYLSCLEKHVSFLDFTELEEANL